MTVRKKAPLRAREGVRAERVAYRICAAPPNPLKCAARLRMRLLVFFLFVARKSNSHSTSYLISLCTPIVLVVDFVVRIAVNEKRVEGGITGTGVAAAVLPQAVDQPSCTQ